MSADGPDSSFSACSAPEEKWRIRTSTGRFPASVEDKEASGLPWGCAVRPFSPPDGIPVVSASDIHRCDNCFAYPNRLCSFEYRRWKCSICGHRNRLPSRYSRQIDRQRAPELNSDCYEIEQPVTEEDEVAFGKQAAYIALVDITGDGDFTELIRNSLAAAVSALQPTDLFGIVVFSEDIGIYDLQAGKPPPRPRPRRPRRPRRLRLPVGIAPAM